MLKNEILKKTANMLYYSQKEVGMNKKIYNDVVNGKSDNNINFDDFRNLIVDLGFDFIRQNGSHKQYFHRGINVFMNVQNDKSKAKAYEVRQLRRIIKTYNL